MRVLAFLCIGAASAAADPASTVLNTGAHMPLVNCGGTAPSVVPGDHASNYSLWMRIAHSTGGLIGIDTALTYTDGINYQIRDAIKARTEIPRDKLFITTKVPCCPGTGYCKQGEYNGTIREDMQKNNDLLQLKTTDLTLLHHPCDTVAHTIERYVELQDGLKVRCQCPHCVLAAAVLMTKARGVCAGGVDQGHRGVQFRRGASRTGERWLVVGWRLSGWWVVDCGEKN